MAHPARPYRWPNGLPLAPDPFRYGTEAVLEQTQRLIDLARESVEEDNP